MTSLQESIGLSGAKDVDVVKSRLVKLLAASERRVVAM